MLSEEDKREMREDAGSKELQRDFEALRRNSRPADPKDLDLDAYLGFLKGFGRIFPQATRSRIIPDGEFRI